MKQIIKQRDITFVHCPDSTYSDNQNYGVEFMPLWIYTLASYIEYVDKFKLDVIDTRFRNIDEAMDSKIFIFSGINQDYHSIKQSHEYIKNKFKHSKFIIGGPICWSFNEAGQINKLKFFDHIIIGDGELIISDIVNNIINVNSMEKIIEVKNRFDLNKSKEIYYPLIEKSINQYYGAVIEIQRGCPFLCEFCDIRVLPDNNTTHCKPIKIVIKEIEHLIEMGKKQFILSCDNFIGDPVWVEEFLNELILLQERTNKFVSIYTWVTININNYPRLLRKMRLAGFDLLFIGIESFNQNSLIETAKLQNAKDELVDMIRNIQSYGFIIVAGLIFGFDTDQEDCFEITIDGLRDSGLISGDPSFLTALPGTPLYRRMMLSNRLRDEGDLISSASTGGVKYQTNIKYLLSEEQLVNGFLKFIQNYNDGSYQLLRLKNYYSVLSSSDNYISLRSQSGGFINAFMFLLTNIKSIKMVIIRLFAFMGKPRNIYFVLIGFFYMLRKKGSLNPFLFWLFSWSNYIMKYSGLNYSDFDLEGVDTNFDIEKQLIPDNYREFATESIPQKKIDAQFRATVKGLGIVIDEQKNTLNSEI